MSFSLHSVSFLSFWVILKVLSFATTCLKQENHSLSAKRKEKRQCKLLSSSIDDEMNVKKERTRNERERLDRTSYSTFHFLCHRMMIWESEPSFSLFKLVNCLFLRQDWQEKEWEVHFLFTQWMSLYNSRQQFWLWMLIRLSSRKYHHTISLPKVESLFVCMNLPTFHKSLLVYCRVDITLPFITWESELPLSPFLHTICESYTTDGKAGRKMGCEWRSFGSVFPLPGKESKVTMQQWKGVYFSFNAV